MEGPVIKLLISLVSPFINIIKWILGKFKKPEPLSVIKRRAKLNSEFRYNISDKNEHGSLNRVIIRDLRRMDEYPDFETKKKGTSPYFTVELKDIYHRGIEVFVSKPKYIKQNDDSKWEFTKDGYKGKKILAWPIARIPFDLIDYVNWDGDEYHNYPIVFCRFDGIEGGPYEEIPFFSREGSGENEYFREIKSFCPWGGKGNRLLRFLKLKK